MKGTKKINKFKYTRGNVLSSECPSREILNHITSRWGVLILVSLSNGEVMRFSELRRNIDGVSEKMLGQTLKKLEADGLILRKSYHQVPPVVEYSLTKKGLEVAPLLLDLVNWIEDNIFKLATV
ncbi:winged helix-turn-helix transcriptional regulator [Flavobacterium alkalisoli]|uniref:winged helix-turn-helix transcriptional regulator n=1 Tax=Flavobacterium alkalisoli TaxID=2602769 RepID=UPI003A93BDE0